MCKYKNIFGEPGKGNHSYRIIDIALVDLFATILVAYIISKYNKLNFVKVLLILLLIGILFHHAFCVETTIDKILFPKLK